MQTTDIIGVKELRTNLDRYINRVRKGETITVVKRSKAVFKIVPLEKEEQWEQIVDFTTINKGGVSISELLSRL